MIALRKLARIGLGVTFAVASGLGLSACEDDFNDFYYDPAYEAASVCGLEIDPTTVEEDRIADEEPYDAFTYRAETGEYVAYYYLSSDWVRSEVYCPGDRAGLSRWSGKHGKWVRVN